MIYIHYGHDTEQNYQNSICALGCKRDPDKTTLSDFTYFAFNSVY